MAPVNVPIAEEKPVPSGNRGAADDDTEADAARDEVADVDAERDGALVRDGERLCVAVALAARVGVVVRDAGMLRDGDMLLPNDLERDAVADALGVGDGGIMHDVRMTDPAAPAPVEPPAYVTAPALARLALT